MFIFEIDWLHSALSFKAVECDTEILKEFCDAKCESGKWRLNTFKQWVPNWMRKVADEWMSWVA